MLAGKDLVCFSSQRWHFVWQRSQQLLSRAARDRRVWFVEDPIESDETEARLEVITLGDRLSLVVPHVPASWPAQARCLAQRDLLTDLWRARRFDQPVLWYTTPAALSYSRTLATGCVVYDCTDAPSLRAEVPASLTKLDTEMLDRADLVFTGGVALFEALKHRHKAVHAFPGSVDTTHFATARTGLPVPPDQAMLGGPIVGMVGVLDDRLDAQLLASVATARPELQFVLLGPLARSEASLPVARNIHYIGHKSYEQLPSYLAGWHVAMLPFAHNDATRYISPTSVPEYLAAGRPVVATSITDVVRPYGVQRLVRIADDPAAFAQAIDHALADGQGRQARADAFLAHLSWDRTWQDMHALIASSARRPRPAAQGRAVSRAPVGTVAARTFTS